MYEFDRIQRQECPPSNFLHTYEFSSSVTDLYLLTSFSIFTSIYVLIHYYYQDENSQTTTFTKDSINIFHPSGDRKNKEEIEQEVLESPLLPRLVNYVKILSFPCEIL